MTRKFLLVTSFLGLIVVACKKPDQPQPAEEAQQSQTTAANVDSNAVVIDNGQATILGIPDTVHHNICYMGWWNGETNRSISCVPMHDDDTRSRLIR